MTEAVRRRYRKGGGMMAGVIGVVLCLGGCAGEPPKASPTITPDQVRSHADKAFEKLKTEEQNRAADPAVTP